MSDTGTHWWQADQGFQFGWWASDHIQLEALIVYQWRHLGVGSGHCRLPPPRKVVWRRQEGAIPPPLAFHHHPLPPVTDAEIPA